MFKAILAALLLIGTNSRASASDATECYPKNLLDDPKRMVCVCSVEKCGFLNTRQPSNSGDNLVYLSSGSGKRFFETQLDVGSGVQATSTITIDTGKSYQTILGFGGSFTDAFGYNMKHLPESLANQAMLSYFGPNGSGYTIGRVPLGCSDQSTHFYSYDETNNFEYDLELNNFSLQYADYNYKIPYIMQAVEINSLQDAKLSLFASPWTPPRWMKKGHSVYQGELLDDTRVKQAYAEYYTRFFIEYKQQFGIEFFGSTVQNEALAGPNLPSAPNLSFNGTQDYADFVKLYLGPTMKKHGVLTDQFTLMLGDDFGKFTNLYGQMLADPEVREYVTGYAYHYYQDKDDSSKVFSRLDEFYETYKTFLKRFIMSEASKIDVNSQKMGQWSRGEDFVRDIIYDTLNNVESWIDWTMMVSIQDGGPTWTNNPLDAPLMANEDYTEFYKLATYYGIAHFSRFVQPNSRRVDVQPKPNKYNAALLYVPFVNEDENLLVVVALNTGNSSERIEINLNSGNSGPTSLGQLVLESNSFGTLLYKLSN